MDEDLPFDPATIREHVQRVKRAAGRQLVGMTLLGLLIGAAVGPVFSNVIDSKVFFSIFTALVGGVAGFMVGDANSESMELAARTALAQAAAAESR